MNCTVLHNRRGSGMVLGLAVLSLVFAFGVSFLSLATSALITSQRDGLRARALACAEAGVDKAISMLMVQSAPGQMPGDWRTDPPGTPGGQHLQLALGTGETVDVYCVDGTGVHAGKIVVTSSGTVTEGRYTVKRTVKAVLELDCENVCVWNNVIFGGVGQAGRSINGNVAMRGSVHLLGDGEEYTDLDSDGHWDNSEPYIDSNSNGSYDLGEPYVDSDLDGHRDAREPYVDVNGNGMRDPALTVTDMASEISGTANHGNNYSGMLADLRARVPDPPTTVFGGEVVDSLSAKLRVKHGRVNISGSATVGDPDTAGDSDKETVDGTYVSDGFGGNAGTGSVYSDNGYANGYDLGDGLVTMPVIDSGVYTHDGVDYANYLAYLQAHATVHFGDLYIQKGVPFSLVGPKGSLTVDAAGNMNISGIVYVTGNISFGPSKSRIYYSNSGTLVTPESIYVHCDVVPATNFPRNDALGLVAGRRIELATGSGDAQLTMALAMYAQHRVVSAKQSEIAGTIVSSYYVMSNVPKIYQVPELVDHLPPGLPGADPIWIASISVVSWQEVSG